MPLFSRYYSRLSDNTELCYYIEHGTELSLEKLESVLGPLSDKSFLISITSGIFEIGPKLSFKTSWCSNALAIFKKCGLTDITRIEKSYRMIGTEPAFDSMTQQSYSSPLNSFEFEIIPNSTYTVPLPQISQFCVDHSLNWDQADIEYYSSLFRDRDPTNVELMDLAQSNSEHSRHHFFSGQHILQGYPCQKSLFDLIKETLPKQSNSVLAFCDNASAISGYNSSILIPNKFGKYFEQKELLHPTLTAETHNFPTGIAPFPGAATGVGGRVRDTIAIGRGGYMVAGTAGYCVADSELLIRASNGASDYGNKLGEPIVCGFTHYYDNKINGERWAWIKPIMFSGGVGMVTDRNLIKDVVVPDLAIVRVGGPAYRIGVGGSAASSSHQSSEEKYQHAVQRGDPEMENRMYKFIRACIELPNNPILSIHDQGAGGAANVTKEIVQPCGGVVDIRNITSGDPSLTTVEKWIAEYQEQVTILVRKNDLEILQQIAERENVDISVFGYTSNDGYIRVNDESGQPVCLNLAKIFHTPKKVYTDETKAILPIPVQINISFIDAIERVFSLVSVGSKRFLTTKVDRSVSGLIAQQQCVGPLQLPLSDFALTAHSYFELTGTAMAIGERPLIGFIAPDEMGRLAVVEMLLNMVWVGLSSLTDIKCSVNWMWPAKLPGENSAMYQCMLSLSKYMIDLGISADGGKDSVSMYTRTADGLVKSPRNVVVTGYCTVPDITRKVTPELKANYESVLIWIGEQCPGDAGSSLMQALGTSGNQGTFVPWAPDASEMVRLFSTLQKFVKNGWIIAGHDISDGGLITTILEMAIVGNIGLALTFKDIGNYLDLFTEHPGVVIQVPFNKLEQVKAELADNLLAFQQIGAPTRAPHVSIEFSGKLLMSTPLQIVRQWWDHSSVEHEQLQTLPMLVEAERVHVIQGYESTWMTDQFIDDLPILPRRYSVAILRDEGSNGEREMAAAFYAAGFNVFDLTMVDVQKNPNILQKFRGLAFVGGFTYADVFGAGAGWAAQIKHSETLCRAFQDFRDRPDTFSLGVCNGCQLMIQLNWVPKCTITTNNSGRFESRWSTVKIKNSKSIMMKDLDMTIFGIWIAHGEGKIEGEIPKENIVLQYVTRTFEPTERYPINPNGSTNGITGLCSDDGRHLAMMPHPERCWQTWQCPWVPEWYQARYTPWFKMFVNARQWCQ